MSIELAPEVYVKPPQNPALVEIRTAETDEERTIKSAMLNQSSVVSIQASDKYREAEYPMQMHILMLLGALAIYLVFLKK